MTLVRESIGSGTRGHMHGGACAPTNFYSGGQCPHKTLQWQAHDSGIRGISCLHKNVHADGRVVDLRSNLRASTSENFSGGHAPRIA